MNTPQSIYLVAALLGTASFLVSWIGYLRCAFVAFRSTSHPIALHFGLWSRQKLSVATTDTGFVISSACRSYGDEAYVDASWKAARAFGILALIFGTIFLLTNIVACCAKPSKSKAVIGPGYAIASLFSGLSLLFLDSNVCSDNPVIRKWNDPDSSPLKDVTWAETCSVSTGAKCIISATAMYFVASILTCVARAEEKEDEQSPVGGGQFDGSLEDPFLAKEPSIFLRR